MPAFDENTSKIFSFATSAQICACFDLKSFLVKTKFLSKESFGKNKGFIEKKCWVKQ